MSLQARLGMGGGLEAEGRAAGGQDRAEVLPRYPIFCLLGAQPSHGEGQDQAISRARNFQSIFLSRKEHTHHLLPAYSQPSGGQKWLTAGALKTEPKDLANTPLATSCHMLGRWPM